MPYSFELLPDEPILINTVSESFSLEHNIDARFNDLAYYLNAATQPLCLIDDVRDLRIDAFHDLLFALNKAIEAQGVISKNPNLIAVIAVTTSTLIKRTAQSLGSNTFGNIDIQVFETLEEALDYARMIIAQK